MPGSYTDGSTWPQGSTPTGPRAETQTCMCAHGGRHRAHRQTHLCLTLQVCPDAGVHWADSGVHMTLCFWEFIPLSTWIPVCANSVPCALPWWHTQACKGEEGNLNCLLPRGESIPARGTLKNRFTFSLGSSALPVSSCLPPQEQSPGWWSPVPRCAHTMACHLHTPASPPTGARCSRQGRWWVWR